MERGKESEGEREKGKAIKLSKRETLFNYCGGFLEAAFYKIQELCSTTQGYHVSYDQADSILVEPWGGTGGSKWNCKLKSPIKEILIAHEDVINSIMFRTVTEQGTTIDSPKFGGNGGRINKVVIEEPPLEYLTGIKGTFGNCGNRSVIKSLCFITNAKNYGPFGSEASGTPFSLVMKGVAIVGFHGRCGVYLDAIGVHLQKLGPSTSAKEPMVEDIEIRNEYQVSYNQSDSILVEPWGGIGGSKWNYMLKSPIKEILIAHGDIIDSITFRTITEQGTTIDSTKFGGDGGRRDKVVIEATPLEYLTGIKGTFGHFGSDLVIKSLCFITNAKNYGPFGSEASGTPFSLVMKEGVAIAGFHGRCGLYLDAIGVYLRKHTPSTSAKEPTVEDIEICDEYQVSYDQADSILVEPWGGIGGSEWNYMLKSPIKEILIVHGDIINSIMFRTVTEQGTTIDSTIFGGVGGRRDKVVIEEPLLEYLIGIKGTFGNYGNCSVIKSLYFITNAKNYGPFGSEASGTPFSLVMKEGVAIAGFHGRCGLYLDAIGVYLRKHTPSTSAKEPTVEDIEICDVSFSTIRKDTFNVLDFIEILKNEEIQKIIDVDLIKKLILELDFLILNLHHLSKYHIEQLSPFMTEYEILHNVCGNIRDFHELIVNGCVRHEIVEYLLPQFQLMVERVGRFLWPNQIGGHSPEHLFFEIIPTQLEVMHICFTNLNASTSVEVGHFIKQLIETSPDILREYLIHLQEHMINIITASTPGARNMYIMIEFLLIILTDVARDFIRTSKLFEFLARVGALTRDVSAIAHDLEEKSKNGESTYVTNSATLGLLKNIELLKRELKDVFLKAPDSSQLCFPMSDGPLFMHLLLRHLNDLLNSNAYLVALIEEEIRIVKEDLEFIRSFFGNVQQELYKDLWARVLDVAYETKDAIDSIIIRDNGLLHLIFSLPVAIEKINLIKEGVSNLFEKIPKNMGVIVVNSPSKPLERKSSIAGKLIVGFKEETYLIIRKLTSGPKTLDVISITGMPGSGKTTLAYKVYNDKSVVGHFDIRAWCTVDQKYDEMELLKKLFNQVTGSTLKFSENIDVVDELRKYLFGKRYLIVLDDLWDTAAWDELTRPFPEVEKGSRLILTTREKKVAMHAQCHSDPLDLRLLRPEESWELLEKKVFGKESCPDELVDVGKEIVRNCKQLPLVVDLIAGVIAGKEMKRGVWLEVQNNLNSFILQKEENVMKVIALSYYYLPDPLKLCLLYFASYEKDRAIPVEVLKRFWRAEGFAEQTEMNRVEEVMDVYLENLISSSLVMCFSEIGKQPTCQIHDLVHDFCLIKAREEKLFDSITSSASSSSSLDLMPRQMSIRCSEGHKNFILFDSANKRHSGYRHLYSLRITDNIYPDNRLYDICHLRYFRLLRVLQLDMFCLTVNDSLLNEICTLVHLRYLNIRANVKSLPSSFSNLWNLETLCVNKTGPPLVILPTIWNLVKLRVLSIYNCSFFDLDKNEPIVIAEDSKSENLRLIQGLKVSYSKDTEDIFKRLPNLQELRFDLKESWDCSTGRYWFPKLEFLNELDSLKVTFERSNSKDSALSVATNWLWDFHLPSSVKMLCLRGFPLTSDSLSTIAKLPKLEDLYLDDAIIKGEAWNFEEEDTFQSLKCLTLAGVNLAKWEVREESFPALEKLRLWYCRKLEEIPPSFGNICSLKSIELKWSPQLEESALTIKQDVEDTMGEDRIQVLVHK